MRAALRVMLLLSFAALISLVQMQRIIPLINRIVLLLLVLLVFAKAFIPRLRLQHAETVFYILFTVYVILALIELLLNIKATKPAEGRTYLSFRYLTRLFLFKKLIVNVLILIMAVTATYYKVPPELVFFLFGIVVVDAVSFIIRLLAGYYSVILEELTFSIITDQEKVVHSARIKLVEFRYDVFFFKMKDDSVNEVSVENIERAKQRIFVSEMVAWIERHQIVISEEAREKLKSWT
jgi:hypothetical protein